MKVFSKGILCITLALTACSQSHPKSSQALSLKDCPEIQNLEPLFEAETPRVIIVGESHGMQEPPALVEALLCHSLARGFKTNLALEVSDDAGLYMSYLDTEGRDDDKLALFDDWAWKSEFTDGRSSEAMLSLIDKARSYMTAGQDLSFTAFKADDLNQENFDDRNSYTQAYEKKMAENILVSSQSAQKTIALVGNLHARRDRRERGTSSYDLMAKHMPAPYTSSFFIVHKGGTAWNCRSGKPEDCKQYKSGAYVGADSDLAKSEILQIMYNEDEAEIAPFIGRQYQKDWYDGVIYVGDVTASPPANRDGRVPYVEDEK
ncbi:hypothetical protein N9W89_00605 [Hellea sp.]|nr:hypothetical protein [Hellea sp.]